jgi:hypothetical protein
LSKLGKVLLFSIVFEITFAVLYFGHLADTALSSMGSNQNVSSIVNSATSNVGNNSLQEFVTLLVSNPIALGIIWSGLNVMIIVRLALRSKSTI